MDSNTHPTSHHGRDVGYNAGLSRRRSRVRVPSAPQTEYAVTPRQLAILRKVSWAVDGLRVRSVSSVPGVPRYELEDLAARGVLARPHGRWVVTSAGRDALNGGTNG